MNDKKRIAWLNKKLKEDPFFMLDGENFAAAIDNAIADEKIAKEYFKKQNPQWLKDIVDTTPSGRKVVNINKLQKRVNKEWSVMAERLVNIPPELL